MLPVVFSVTSRLGLNSYAFAVGLTISGAMAVATPLANSTIGMAMIAKYKFSDFVKYAGPITLVAVLVLTLVVPAIYPLKPDDANAVPVPLTTIAEELSEDGEADAVEETTAAEAETTAPEAETASVEETAVPEVETTVAANP